MLDLIASFPLLMMTLGGIGATLGLHLFTKSTVDEVFMKGMGLFLTIIMTYVCFSGAAYAMTQTILENPEVYFKAIEE